MRTRRLVFAAVIGMFAQIQPAATMAVQPDATSEIVATQLRRQGYACTAPHGAVRDPDHSKPHETVWILRCDEATYRITLIPSREAPTTIISREENGRILYGSERLGRK